MRALAEPGTNLVLPLSCAPKVSACETLRSAASIKAAPAAKGQPGDDCGDMGAL